MPPFQSRTGALAVADMTLSRTANVAALAKSDPGLAVQQYYLPALTELVSPQHPNTPRVCAPIPRPLANDWLADHQENGQSITSFLRGQLRARPHGNFNTIVIVILGKGMPVPHLPELKEYVEAFFQCNVKIVGPLDIPGNCAHRATDACSRQYLCDDMEKLAVGATVADRSLTRCTVYTIGVTMFDLTPNFESYNFVYGRSSLAEGRGVFSLCRFAPEYNGEAASGKKERDSIIFKRACKVITHETMHGFGIRHCTNHICLINGANHVRELERQPLVECPVHTSMLLVSFGWDLRVRYARLAEVGTKFGFEQEAAVWASLAQYYTVFHEGVSAASSSMSGIVSTSTSAAASKAVGVAGASVRPAAAAFATVPVAASQAPAAVSSGVRRIPLQMGTLYSH